MDTDNKYLQDALLMGSTRNIVDTALGIRTAEEKRQADAKTSEALFKEIRTKALMELVNAMVGKDFADRLQVYSLPRRRMNALDDECNHAVFTTREPGGFDIYVHFTVKNFYTQPDMVINWYWNGTANAPITTDGWYEYNRDLEPLENLYLATLEGIELYHGKPRTYSAQEPEQVPAKELTPGEKLLAALNEYLASEFYG